MLTAFLPAHTPYPRFEFERVQAAVKGRSLVIHAAGPFQRTENHSVLEQAIEERVAYLDVCDDLHYAEV